MHDDWIIWQLLDSGFPSGAFAHSAGLESAWQQGFVVDSAELREMAETFLLQQARGPAVLTVAACREPGRFAELDALAEAMLANHVANRASRAQGRALAQAAARIFGQAELAGHAAPVLGVIAAGLGLTDERAARAAIFLALRGFLSAAVRLGALGAFEAQAMQRSLALFAERAARLALSIEPEDASQAAPVLDLLQQTHDLLYSRLFQS